MGCNRTDDIFVDRRRLPLPSNLEREKENCWFKWFSLRNVYDEVPCPKFDTEALDIPAVLLTGYFFIRVRLYRFNLSGIKKVYSPRIF